MCKWMSMLIDRNGKVWMDGNITSHEELVKKSGWKDDRLENRDFVRVEISPKPKTFSAKRENWIFKVDEEGTLPKWYSENREKNETACWKAWKSELARLKNVPKVERFIASLKKVPWLKPDGKPKKEWKLSEGKEWSAARSAAESAARSAAWSAAWSAAESAAWSAAGSAAWSAADEVSVRSIGATMS